MALRRGTVIGFVLVAVASFLFSSEAGSRIAAALKDLPLAAARHLNGDPANDRIVLNDHFMPPRNLPPSKLASFFVIAPIGLSLAAGFAFVRLWQIHSNSLVNKVLVVVCFGVLLALSGVNLGWNSDRDRDTANEVWLGVTMTLVGFLFLILDCLSEAPTTDTGIINRVFGNTLVLVKTDPLQG